VTFRTRRLKQSIDGVKLFSLDDARDDLVGGKWPVNLKKPSGRRNAWGCLSYADLIARAIESTTDKRLTLSQIYEWMVENIPYFRDKGESTSSAGWKVNIYSIRILSINLYQALAKVYWVA